MTDIEKKALALVNEVLAERGEQQCVFLDRVEHVADEALCRAIEQHEAFRQEVSDSLEDVRDNTTYDLHPKLWRYIRTKPADPLVEAWNDMLRESKPGEDRLDVFREALAKRGLEVTEIER